MNLYLLAVESVNCAGQVPGRLPQVVRFHLHLGLTAFGDLAAWSLPPPGEAVSLLRLVDFVIGIQFQGFTRTQSALG